MNLKPHTPPPFELVRAGNGHTFSTLNGPLYGKELRHVGPRRPMFEDLSKISQPKPNAKPE